MIEKDKIKRSWTEEVSGPQNVLCVSFSKQECIPVGCVPFAAVAVSGRGGWYLLRGGLPGRCLLREGVSAWGCLPGGVCLEGCLPGGMSAYGGCLPDIPRPRGRHPPPRTESQIGVKTLPFRTTDAFMLVKRLHRKVFCRPWMWIADLISLRNLVLLRVQE